MWTICSFVCACVLCVCVCALGISGKIPVGFLREENDLPSDRQDSEQCGENSRWNSREQRQRFVTTSHSFHSMLYLPSFFTSFLPSSLSFFLSSFLPSFLTHFLSFSLSYFIATLLTSLIPLFCHPNFFFLSFSLFCIFFSLESTALPFLIPYLFCHFSSLFPSRPFSIPFLFLISILLSLSPFPYHYHYSSPSPPPSPSPSADDSTSVGQALSILCQDFQTQVAHRKYFYRSGKLVIISYYILSYYLFFYLFTCSLNWSHLTFKSLI